MKFQDVFGDIRRATGGKKRGPRPKILTREEKYQKRLDANDRERQRMGQLNVAFNHLRNVLPKHGNDRELSKFETIHLAKNYIRALNEMLSQAEQQQHNIEIKTTGITTDGATNYGKSFREYGTGAEENDFGCISIHFD